jgi:plastocyanin
MPRREADSNEVLLMKVFFAAITMAAATLALCTQAAGAAPVTLTIKDHKFAPAEIRVKADTPSEFTIVNQDATVEEFDSTSLKVEKVVSGNAQGTVRIRPLAPGRYPFMGEFHSDSAEGVVIAE